MMSFADLTQMGSRKFTFELSHGLVVRNRTFKKGAWLFSKYIYCPDCWREGPKGPVKRGKYCRMSYLLSRLPLGTFVENSVIYTSDYENKYVKALFNEYGFMVQKSIFDV